MNDYMKTALIIIIAFFLGKLVSQILNLTGIWPTQ